MTKQSEEITIETLQPMRVAGLRHIGPYPEIGAAWDKFCAWLREKKMGGPGVLALGVFWDNPCEVPESELRSDAAITVAEDFELEPGGLEGLSIHELDLGECAVWEHRGPYEQLGAAWSDFVGKKMPAAGLKSRPGVPCVEIYLNDPSETKPEDLRTRLCEPIQPRD